MVNTRDANKASREHVVFLDLINPHLPTLRRLALRLTTSLLDAEDLVQEVLEKLYVHRFRLAHVEDLRPWLFKVMYYHFLDRSRKTRRWTRVGFTDAADDAGIAASVRAWAVEDDGHSMNALTGPELCAFRMQLKDFVGMALAELAPNQHRAITSHDLESQSLHEIALAHGISVHTLKSALTQARAKLRKRLSQFEPISAQLSRRRAGIAGRPARAANAYRRMRRRNGGSGGDQLGSSPS